MRSDGECLQPGRPQAPIELGREEQVGELGGAVGDPCVVERCSGDVIRSQPAHAVQIRADGDDAGALGCRYAVEQQAGQCEVAQVVRRHLQLETVGGLPVGRAHHAGVVHQKVEAGVLGQDSFGGPVHGHEVGQIEVDELERRAVEFALHFVARPARPFLVAAGQDHVRTVLGQCGRRLVADAAVRPGDERNPAGEVADVRGAPRGAPGDLAPGDPGHALPM